MDVGLAASGPNEIDWIGLSHAAALRLRVGQFRALKIFARDGVKLFVWGAWLGGGDHSIEFQAGILQDAF